MSTDLSDLDLRVYRALASYAPDEAVCFPSQSLLAKDLEIARETVNRSIKKLISAGWVRIAEKIWSKRSRWVYNVYELLEPFVVSDLAMRRITRRAHTRKPRWKSPHHTNEGENEQKTPCSCRFCRKDRTRVRLIPRLILRKSRE